MEVVCEVCGNMLEAARPVCPFCGYKQVHRGGTKGKTFIHRKVNLEAGRPVVEQALDRMIEVIDDGARNGVTVVTLIHGYGSSGKGGAIRVECRKMLDYLKSKERIADYIPGEDFTKRANRVKVLLRRHPQLKLDRNLNKGNRGITVVILSNVLLCLQLLPAVPIVTSVFIS